MTEMQHLKLFKEMDKNLDWLNNNMDWLKEKYDQKFIAIKDNKIIAEGILMEGVIKKLKIRGVDPSETLIQFISKMTVVL